MEQYLFVIDYQNDFVDGALGFPGAEQLDEGIAEKIRHCVQGSHGWALYGKTAQALADCGAKGIDKPAFGIDCGDPTVLAVLPERADRIELVGLVSNICVVSNAVVLQSRYPEARIVVDAALTASFDPKLHGEVLDVLEGLQVEVLNRA